MKNRAKAMGFLLLLAMAICSVIVLSAAAASGDPFEVIDAASEALTAKYGIRVFWPLEAQYEIAQLRVLLGLENEPTAGLPTPTEIQQEEAIEIAVKAMMKEFSFTQAEMDAMYAGVAFFTTFPDHGRVWQVNFVPNTLSVRKNGTNQEYNVALRPDTGEIIDILPPFI